MLVGGVRLTRGLTGLDATEEGVKRLDQALTGDLQALRQCGFGNPAYCVANGPGRLIDVRAGVSGQAGLVAQPRGLQQRVVHLAVRSDALLRQLDLGRVRVDDARSPLPVGVPLSRLRFSLRDSKGGIQSFVPRADEVIQRKVQQYLDILKAAARVTQTN